MTVAEPNISTFSKSITATPTDAGDNVVYTITLANAAGPNVSTAYDIVVADTLDNDLSFVSFTPSFGAQTAPADTTPQTVTRSGSVYTVSRLDPGQTVTIAITAQVAGAASAGETIPNQATMTYTSLPGANGTARGNPTGSTAPGAPGTQTGERTGSGGPNDYSGVTGVVNITMPQPALDKLDLSATSYSIGQQVTYYLNVTLPEGVVENMVVADNLPPAVDAVELSDHHQRLLKRHHQHGDGQLQRLCRPRRHQHRWRNRRPGHRHRPRQRHDRRRQRSGHQQLLGQGRRVRVEYPGHERRRQPGEQRGAHVRRPAHEHIHHLIMVLRNAVHADRHDHGRDRGAASTLNKSILTPPSPADAGGVVTYRITITNATGATISPAYDARYRDTLLPALTLKPASVAITTAGGAAGVADSSAGNTVDA